MDIFTVIRTGFSTVNIDEPSWSKFVIHYNLGEPFQNVWETVLKARTEYALIVDDIIPCNKRIVWLLHQLLDTNSNMFGVTLDAEGLETVYGVTVPLCLNSRLPWSAIQITTLPSWLALLRVSYCQKLQLQTPEFFLLRQSWGRNVLRTVLPRLDFDPLHWAGDVISSSAVKLAADYENFKKHVSSVEVPLQFRVTIPGENKIIQPLQKSTPNPLFSVICPSIRPDFLREAVTSITNQTYPKWELWIGIDGPVEIQRKKIEDILIDFHSEHRIHIRYYKHMGTGPLRQLLSENARGDYIIGLDDDDRLPPNALERFAKAVKANPGIPILRGGIRLFGLIEIYLSPRRRFRINGISNDLFEVNQPYVVRKDILEYLGGLEWDPGMKNAGEDSDLLLKADREGLPIHLIDEPLYERRLSTLNQTLDCTAEECRNHIHNLYGKHNPSGWMLNDVRLSGRGPMIKMVTSHRHTDRKENIVCSTQFMNFQQVGSSDNVVLDLEVTSLCSADCIFCPHSQSERNEKFISIENIRRIASFFNGKAIKPTIVLCGIGEPTLHPRLEELVSILAQTNINVGMTTNGWNITTTLLDTLVKAGLSELNVSLNAATKHTHEKITNMKNYDTIFSVCKEISKIREQKWPSLKFHVSFVLTRENEGEVKMFVDQWNDSGVTEIWLHPLTNRAGLISPNYPSESINKISNAFSGEKNVKVDLFPKEEGPYNLCHIASGIDFISVDGEMLLCAQDYKAEYKFGNVAGEDLEGLHNNKIIRHLRGETADLCSKCTFCPSGFRKGQDKSYSIVQSGAF